MTILFRISAAKCLGGQEEPRSYSPTSSLRRSSIIDRSALPLRQLPRAPILYARAPNGASSRDRAYYTSTIDRYPTSEGTASSKAKSGKAKDVQSQADFFVSRHPVKRKGSESHGGRVDEVVKDDDEEDVELFDEESMHNVVKPPNPTTSSKGEER
ncbi:uncharacterized protein ARMOST_13297 [Armillaria ostoyae]|uniref:Uncharacterized protein n=1 Tax=Armillaria ostoyae TaxID=47428 RepID=A0A284RMB8_ARMOS|nr:uncharacterized protein ARMOST_13297 [Armillaria ostoyae]